MRNCAILPSSSEPSTDFTVAFIDRTPAKPSRPQALPGSLSLLLIGGANDLPLCRVLRYRPRGQSLMEPLVKAKRRACGSGGAGLPHESRRPTVVVFRISSRDFSQRG